MGRLEQDKDFSFCGIKKRRNRVMMKLYLTVFMLALFITGMVADKILNTSELKHKGLSADPTPFCIADLDCGFSPMTCSTACVNILKCLFAFCHEDQECCCYGCP